MIDSNFINISVVRAACAALSQKDRIFKSAQVIEKISVKDKKSKNKVYDALRTMRDQGEIRHLNKGVWKFLDKDRPEEKRKIMWRILRARKSITLIDLVEMSGVSMPYADEWLRGLLKQDIVKKDDLVYRLINDTVVMPIDTTNTEKCRFLRIKKRLLESLKQAKSSLERKTTDTECALNAINKALILIETELRTMNTEQEADNTNTLQSHNEGYQRC